jgi:hypothetical protein
MEKKGRAWIVPRRLEINDSGEVEELYRCDRRAKAVKAR